MGSKSSWHAAQAGSLRWASERALALAMGSNLGSGGTSAGGSSGAEQNSASRTIFPRRMGTALLCQLLHEDTVSGERKRLHCDPSAGGVCAVEGTVAVDQNRMTMCPVRFGRGTFGSGGTLRGRGSAGPTRKRSRDLAALNRHSPLCRARILKRLVCSAEVTWQMDRPSGPALDDTHPAGTGAVAGVASCLIGIANIGIFFWWVVRQVKCLRSVGVMSQDMGDSSASGHR